MCPSVIEYRCCVWGEGEPDSGSTSNESLREGRETLDTASWWRYDGLISHNLNALLLYRGIPNYDYKKGKITFHRNTRAKAETSDVSDKPYFIRMSHSHRPAVSSQCSCLIPYRIHPRCSLHSKVKVRILRPARHELNRLVSREGQPQKSNPSRVNEDQLVLSHVIPTSKSYKLTVLYSISDLTEAWARKWCDTRIYSYIMVLYCTHICEAASSMCQCTHCSPEEHGSRELCRLTLTTLTTATTLTQYCHDEWWLERPDCFLLKVCWTHMTSCRTRNAGDSVFLNFEKP